ncbi:related to Tumor susceptibility gene 101 protein [Ustilago sp. UG-2017a]|nr:related to Tumor susceptibility gene 101 protein [Ustilago sp. UG-2017a]
MDHAVVQKWLRSVLGPYTERDRVFADVDRALIAVSSLSPKTEVFTFNDGRTQLLLNLEGTIPVEFRNTTYNIPVAYWIPRGYPREPPMAFVAPTPDMAIRKGPNVDPSGEIGGDYLARWRSKPEACNLLDLIHDCQHMFRKEPPVYAKPKPTAVYAIAASPQQRSQTSTPQQASSSNTFAQRAGPPPLSASPRSPQTTAGPSFHGDHDPRQKPPPPAPAPTPGPSGYHDPAHVQHAPHRPPKPSFSLGPDGNYTPSPRNSMSHMEPSSGPAPLLMRDGMHMQSPQQPATPQQFPDEAYRRYSGAGLGGSAYHPQQNATPPQEQYPVSPVAVPQSSNPASQWQPHANSHPHHQRQGSQQYPQHQQHPQHRAQTYPYPGADQQYHKGRPNSGYNGAQQQQPPSQNGAPPPPVSGPHPYQNSPLPHGGSPAPPSAHGSSNDYLNPPPPGPITAPKPKGINLLDEDDASSSSTPPTLTSASGPVPPPPRPINPELLALHDRVYNKLTSHLSTLSNTLSFTNSRLELLSTDLDRGLPAIEDEMSRLRAVRDVCQTTGDRLSISVNEISESIRNLQAREELDPDSMVLATSIVGNQLVDLVAEDNAIEDTLYHLGRALNAERIDLDRFLKQTRMLAREQFMKRALAMKISDGMGWAQ